MSNLYTRFRDWVNQQDPTKGYFYFNNKNCPFAQFLLSEGRTSVNVGGTYWWQNGDRVPFPSDAFVSALSNSPRNFGGLAERLNAIPDEAFVEAADA